MSELFLYFQTNGLEWFGVITGLLYLFLEIKQKSSMWIVGFTNCLVFVFVFQSSGLYADMVLNLYYVLVSVYGFWKWKSEKTTAANDQHANYKTLNISTGTILVVIASMLFGATAYILKSYTNSTVPYQDALVSSLSMVATWMLAKKIIQHWFVWIFVNGFSVYLFICKALYPTAFLYLFYCVLSLYGFYEWRKVSETPTK